MWILALGRQEGTKQIFFHLERVVHPSSSSRFPSRSAAFKLDSTNSSHKSIYKINKAIIGSWCANIGLPHSTRWLIIGLWLCSLFFRVIKKKKERICGRPISATLHWSMTGPFVAPCAFFLSVRGWDLAAGRCRCTALHHVLLLLLTLAPSSQQCRRLPAGNPRPCSTFH